MADGILSILWDLVEWLIDIGIKFLGNILMGFCSIMLRLVNAASKENLYDSICHAFNSVFWFSGNILIPFGIFILTVILIWNLSKIIMSGQKGSKDDPISLVRRTIVAGIIIWATPVLIVFSLGPSINKNVDGGNVVTNKVSNGLSVMPVLLDGLSSFDGKGGISLSKKSLTALSTFEKTNGEIMVNGMRSIGMKEGDIPDASEFNFSKEKNESSSDVNSADKTAKKDKNGTVVYDQSWSKSDLEAAADSYGIKYKHKKNIKNKDKERKYKSKLIKKLQNYQSEKSNTTGTVLDQLGDQMYTQYSQGGWQTGILWRIIYVVIFLIQPAMIIWNLVQLVWVFVKRAVSLILTACLAPIAIAFYPSQSTTEVTSRWIKMVFGYGITTVLTFAFLKLGAFVYAAAISVQYTEKKLILTITLNFACLAILGFVKEMESYVNNLGGNLVGFKNSISGQLGKLASSWGQKALFAPLGAATTLSRTLPKAVGFATGRQGFFKNIGSRNLNKTKDKMDSNTYTKRANKADKQASKLLKKNPGISTEATKSAENSLNNFNAHKTTNGSLLTGAEIASATEKIPVSPINGNTESLVKASGGTDYLTTENGFGIPKEVFKRGESTGTHNGTELFKPAQEDKHLFNGNTFDENGFISLSSSKEAPMHKIDSSGGFTSLRTQDGNMHIIDNKTTFDEMKNKVPSGTTLNRSSVVENVNGTPIISDGKNAIMASDMKTESEFNAMPPSARKGYEAFGLGGTEGDVVFAKRGSSLENSKLSNK